MTSPIQAFIFDWAGTMVDFGCCAPVVALQKVFAAEGLALTDADARVDMGVAKMDHIRNILGREPMKSLWTEKSGQAPNEADVQRLHDAVIPMMRDAAAECAEMIPGAVALYQQLIEKGVKVGSGTGYTPDMMTAIRPKAAEQGYDPAVVVCAGETAFGRPTPLMTWKAMVDLGVWPARACIKVDDATVGIIEGREAGTWTIGLAASGNGVGLSLEQYRALSPAERAEKVIASAQALAAAGADYVVASVADIPRFLAELETRIAADERPGLGGRIYIDFNAL